MPQSSMSRRRSLATLKSCALSWSSSQNCSECLIIHRRHREVNADADIAAIHLDLEVHHVHQLTANRRVPPPKFRGQKKTKRMRTSAFRDVLTEGIVGLTEGGLFRKWKQRTTEAKAEEIECGQGDIQDIDGEEDMNAQGDEGEEELLGSGYSFKDAEGTFMYDVDEDDNE